jgi:hypothetical protein
MAQDGEWEEAGAGGEHAPGGESEEEQTKGLAQRFFDGEIEALRTKLGQKDVSLAKASRIQKELRWSLDLYNRELSLLRGCSPGRTERARAAATKRVAKSDARHVSLQPQGVWERADSASMAESPAPIPPPRGRRKVRHTGRSSSESRSTSSTSSSSPPPVCPPVHASSQGTLRPPALFSPDSGSVRSRWSPPASLSPISTPRRSSEHDSQTHALTSWSVGALELRERLEADMDAKVDLLVQFKHERERQRQRALLRHQVWPLRSCLHATHLHLLEPPKSRVLTCKENERRCEHS